MGAYGIETASVVVCMLSHLRTRPRAPRRGSIQSSTFRRRGRVHQRSEKSRPIVRTCNSHVRGGHMHNGPPRSHGHVCQGSERGRATTTSEDVTECIDRIRRRDSVHATNRFSDGIVVRTFTDPSSHAAVWSSV